MWPPFAHLELFLGDCFEVFVSNLLVYYSRLPSVLPRVLSSWSSTASTIFRSGLGRGQSITINVLSAVFLSKYDFTDISSVLGIIVILKNFQDHSQSDTFQKEWQAGKKKKNIKKPKEAKKKKHQEETKLSEHLRSLIINKKKWNSSLLSSMDFKAWY